MKRYKRNDYFCRHSKKLYERSLTIHVNREVNGIVNVKKLLIYIENILENQTILNEQNSRKNMIFLNT
jgi:hypothetical protein